MEPPKKLMNKNFFLLWQGQLVSMIGIQAFEIAMMFWIKHATGSATLVGLILMVSSLPAVILGPIGGTFADRYSRRLIIVFSDLFNGIAVIALAVFIFIYPDSTEFIIVWLFVVSVFVQIMGSFFRPAISAAIPDLVPEDRIEGANSLNQSSMRVSLFIGQGLGGVLFRLFGAPLLFLFDGITYLFSAVSESFIKIPQEIPEKSGKLKDIFEDFKKDTIEGFSYVWKRAGMRNLFIAIAFLNFFLYPVLILMPFYVEDFLNVGADWYGFLYAAFSVGALLGYLIAGTVKIKGKVRSTVLITVLILMSVKWGLLGIILIPYGALVLMFLMGIMLGIYSIIVNTILQVSTPTEIRGRVFGLLHTVAIGISPIAMGLAGVVADMTGQNIPAIFITCGGVLVLISVIVGLSPEYRKFLAYEKKEENSE